MLHHEYNHKISYGFSCWWNRVQHSILSSYQYPYLIQACDSSNCYPYQTCLAHKHPLHAMFTVKSNNVDLQFFYELEQHSCPHFQNYFISRMVSGSSNLVGLDYFGTNQEDEDLVAIELGLQINCRDYQLSFRYLPLSSYKSQISFNTALSKNWRKLNHFPVSFATLDGGIQVWSLLPFWTWSRPLLAS